MPYESIDFDDRAQQFTDKDYRLAAIQIHDEMLLAIASIKKLFGEMEVTPERAFVVQRLTSDRYVKLKESAE